MKIDLLDFYATKKNILNFAVDSDLMKRLDDFRFEAIRRLLDETLKKYEKKDKK
jgi:hypothetical protein